MQVLQQLKRHPTKLWRGYTALAARDLPFTALQFPVFEKLKQVLMARKSRLKGGEPVTGLFERAWIAAVSAGLAGSAAAWVTRPSDVVKTRMTLEAGHHLPSSLQAPDEIRMSSGGKGPYYDGQARRRSAIRVAREVLRQEGVRGLYRGGSIRAAFTVVGNGMFMGCYEYVKMYLQEQ